MLEEELLLLFDGGKKLFTPDMYAPAVWLDSEKAAGHTNLLTPNQASLETDTTGWANVANATLARSTAQSLYGVASLAITAIAASTMNVGTLTGVNGIPV